MGRSSTLTRVLRSCLIRPNSQTAAFGQNRPFHISSLRLANFSSVVSVPPLKFTPQNYKTLRHLCFVRKYSSQSEPVATIAQSHGLPVISVPLPSRREVCRFTLRPVTSTVGDFLQNIRNEDLGVDRAAIHSTDGCRVASSTLIGHLLTNDFMLTINDKSYPISPPHKDGVEGTESLDEVRSLVGQLYTRFDVGHHQLLQEQALESRIDGLRVEMEPLEKLKKEMSLKASRRTNMLMWGGLAFMAGQFGVLARLTWWEYSWDIMEPVTYFITYGTAIIMYGYFLLTQQEYLYPDARDRVFLKHFHRQADSKKFNIDKYNQLCDEIARAQQDLARLRDPLQLNLPPEPIRTNDMRDINQK